MKDYKNPGSARPEPLQKERKAMRRAKKRRLACEVRGFAIALVAMLLIMMMLLTMTLPKLAASMPPA